MKAVGAGPHPTMFTETVGSPPVIGQDVVLHGAINTQKTYTVSRSSNIKIKTTKTNRSSNLRGNINCSVCYNLVNFGIVNIILKIMIHCVCSSLSTKYRGVIIASQVELLVHVIYCFLTLRRYGCYENEHFQMGKEVPFLNREQVNGALKQPQL